MCIPILVLCAMIIRAFSKGPVFFTQTRIGRYGLPFKMFKLRTMYRDAEARSGAVWAADNDPRVVPACKWMRISHVDELPQLVNVIRGDMSLVGPRPERLEIMLDIEIQDRHKMLRRLDVKPGITGLAQIRGGYNTSTRSFVRKLKYDVFYIERQSFWLDLWIMIRTIPKVRDSKAN